MDHSISRDEELRPPLEKSIFEKLRSVFLSSSDGSLPVVVAQKRMVRDGIKLKSTTVDINALQQSEYVASTDEVQSVVLKGLAEALAKKHKI